MATININRREVVRKKRNGRADESTTFLASSSFATGGTIIDWAEVTPDLVTINRDLHVTGNITASKDVIAYVAGAVTSDVLDALSVSAPLEKTGTNIQLKVNPAQLEVNGNNELQIKSGVLTPAEHIHTISNVAGLQTALDSKLSTAIKGTANGLAELDANGFVKNAQLPSYVDDVLEYSSFDALPVTGENGKIYITTDNNKTFRWSGSVYAEISSSIALGETSSTAYRGDRGKTAYDHSQTLHDKNFVGLSNVDNTSDLNKPVSTAQQTALNLKVDKVAGKSLVNDTDIAKLTPITVTSTKVTIDRDLHVEGNITASKDVVAYVTGAVTSNVLDALSVSTPLQKTNTNIQLNLNPAQFNIDGNQLNYIGSTGLSSVSWNDVTSKPIFSAVATSGSYTDLSNKPVITSTIAGSTDVATYFTGTKALTAAVADSAISVAWSNVSSKPTALSQFSNDLGNYGGFALQTSISNINNTSDASKPISTATQTALNLKANLASPTFTGTVSGISKSMVGLGNVDNTADASKSVSFANNATYATNSSKLYSIDGSYAYNSGAPYYGYLTYNGNANRWRFKVSPATPDGVEVAFADLAANSDTLDGKHSTDFWEKSGSWISQALLNLGCSRVIGITGESGSSEFGLATVGGRMYPYADGFFYQNEGQYRVIDESDSRLTNSRPANGGTSDYSNLLQVNNSGNQSGVLQYMQMSGQNTAGDNPTGSWCSILKLGHGDADSYYNRTLAFDFFSNDIYTRKRTGGTASGWAKLWTSDNLNPNTKLNRYGDYLDAGTYLGMDGGTSFGLGVLSQNRRSAVFDTVEAGGSDVLELNYYTGSEVHIGSSGSKGLRAGYVVSNGNLIVEGGSYNNGFISLTTIADNDSAGLPWYGMGRAGDGTVRVTGYYGIRLGTSSGSATLNSSGNFTVSGEVTAYSDKRLKSEIKPLTVRGDLKPVSYVKEGKESIGFIAQEVKEVYPELVAGDESKEMLSLNYQQLTAVLYAEILELKERIKKLEGEKYNG